LERLGAQTVRIPKVPARKRQVAMGHGNLAQEAMHVDAVGAAGQQPATLVQRHVDLARCEHLPDFFDVELAIAGAAWVDQLPIVAAG
jgi:hypothetical protein